MIIRELKVVNNIIETGCTNSLISNIENIVECKNNFALLMKKYTLVINKGGVYHKIISHKFRKPDGYDYDKVTCDQYRLTWYYDGLDGKAHHSELNTFRILGIVQQIIDNNGETLQTYNGFEVNHKLPRYFKEVNNITNLEVCDNKQNKRHFIAWQKCQIYNELIPLQMTALGELVPFILSDKTVLVAKGDNYFILRNYDWDGITEYKCIKNPDGIWRFNG